MNAGIKLWERAEQCIPGGNGLLSKRPSRYAPDIWPTYFERASGVEIWDLDGRRFIDMAQMGIGAAILGYANPEVNQAVVGCIGKGVSTTLNPPEEVYLAEKLLELNPFAGGVKFARTGGEAMAMAVRIARAFTGRDKVAFSGYHGWCDWYLATNLGDENKLKDHLLPGLDPKGVPSGLTGTALPFRYNDVDDLERLAQTEDFGVIVLEGARYDFPKPDFIAAVHRVAKQKKALIVLDEITSGWRMTDGGVYKLLGFNPDIVVYGKAMGNGFAISAVVGKREVMATAQESFISSTFWTERVGFVAGLKTIEILLRDRVWEHLIKIGTAIGEGWLRLGKKHGLKLEVTEYKPLISMKLGYGEDNPAIVTFFIQEMLKRGYLAATSVYVSQAHTLKVVEDYLTATDEVFSMLAVAIRTNTVLSKLETRVKSEAFKRLN
ncbi:MAG: aminotransferase class III-fold pyridoxal phosphate-dependent enzyme [Verrucomicrobiota bacterium]